MTLYLLLKQVKKYFGECLWQVAFAEFPLTSFRVGELPVGIDLGFQLESPDF